MVYIKLACKICLRAAQPFLKHFSRYSPMAFSLPGCLSAGIIERSSLALRGWTKEIGRYLNRHMSQQTSVVLILLAFKYYSVNKRIYFFMPQEWQINVWDRSEYWRHWKFMWFTVFNILIVHISFALRDLVFEINMMVTATSVLDSLLLKNSPKQRALQKSLIRKEQSQSFM